MEKKSFNMISKNFFAIDVRISYYLSTMFFDMVLAFSW